jgi:hypothetical protein
MPHGPAAGAPVLVLGWGNSTARQLRPFAELWRGLGHEPSVFVPDTLRSLIAPAHFRRQARGLASGRPAIVHALSDNGFIALSLVLDALRAQGAPPPRAVVLDSCPGVERWRTRRGFAAAFGRGLTPSALRALTPAIELAFRGLHHLVPGSIDMMTSSIERVLERLPSPVPHLVVCGPGDTIVPEAESIAHADRLRARAHPVEVLRVLGSGHVGHLRQEPASYRSHVGGLLERAGLALPRVRD